MPENVFRVALSFQELCLPRFARDIPGGRTPDQSVQHVMVLVTSDAVSPAEGLRVRRSIENAVHFAAYPAVQATTVGTVPQSGHFANQGYLLAIVRRQSKYQAIMQCAPHCSSVES